MYEKRLNLNYNSIIIQEIKKTAKSYHSTYC